MASIKKTGRAADEAQHGLSDRTRATPESYPRSTDEGSQPTENLIRQVLALLLGGARVAQPEAGPLKFQCPPGYDPRRPFLTTEEFAFEWGEHVDTTRRKQHEGGGPPYVIDEHGRARYWRKALDEYHATRLVNNRHEADALLRRDRQRKEDAR